MNITRESTLSELVIFSHKGFNLQFTQKIITGLSC